MHDELIAKCVVGLFCAVSLTSCSLLIETSERQCEQDTDCVDAQLGKICVDRVCKEAQRCEGDACTSTEAASDGKCSSDAQCTTTSIPRCLNGRCVASDLAEQWVCENDEQSIRTSVVRYSFRIVDFLSREPPKNVVVKACRNNDVTCLEPVTIYTDVDGTGHAQFELPSGFLGFFEVDSESMPTLVYVTKPIIKNTSGQDLPLLTADTVRLTADVTGVVIDPTKGLALLQALDCSESSAPGVQFQLKDGSATAFYLVDQIPSLEATVTTFDESTNAATGGFINVEPGYVSFSAHIGVDGLELGAFNAQIRANTITYIDMHL